MLQAVRSIFFIVLTQKTWSPKIRKRFMFDRIDSWSTMSQTQHPLFFEYAWWCEMKGIYFQNVCGILQNFQRIFLENFRKNVYKYSPIYHPEYYQDIHEKFSACFVLLFHLFKTSMLEYFQHTFFSRYIFTEWSWNILQQNILRDTLFGKTFSSHHRNHECEVHRYMCFCVLVYSFIYIYFWL